MRIKRLIVCTVIFSLLLSVSVSASSYQTYTYSYEGNVQISPEAYKAETEIDEVFGFGVLNKPQDIFYDDLDRIIISDTGNSRIVICDSNFNGITSISKFTNNGKEDSLNKPQGSFVDKKGNIYVADTENGRILKFSKDFEFIKEYPPLSADILPDSFIYKPKSICVDNAGRIYVVSLNTNMGVIALDSEGAFEGFIGAQRVSTNPIEILWRSFMSDEQLARSESYVPVEFSNLTIDQKGFIYVTCSQIDSYDLYNAVWSRSNSSTYAPIKKLNPSGTDVLKRNGFFPPVGDITFGAYSSSKLTPSQITEVSLLDNGMYSLLDSERNKLFFYDSNGNLLYAFGGKGESIGLYTKLESFAFNNDRMYTLDSSDGTITVSKKTEYAKLIDKVMGYQENRQYKKAKSLWGEILKYNNNFDMAYLGIGKLCIEQGKYGEALENFRLISNKNYYAKAFQYYREDILSKYGIWIFAIAVLIFVGIFILLNKCSKKNLKNIEVPATGKLKDELLYGLYVIRHPFQGFWGIKKEKRGSVRAATVFWVLTAITSAFSTLGSCYLKKDATSSVATAFLSVVLPLLLWCVSNICFTSLMDGNATFKEIYIVGGYSAVPYILITIPCTAIEYCLTQDELSIIAMVTTIAIYWMIMLILVGSMTVNEYSFGKNLFINILSVLGMAFIVFLILIFVSLTGQVISLVSEIINEISFRR